MCPEPAAGTARSAQSLAPIVAKYTALVSTEVLSSSLTVMPDADRALEALQAAPDYAPAWPPRPLAATFSSVRDVRLLALARLKTLFDFGASLPDDDIGVLRRSMAVRWPELLAPATTMAVAGPYERIAVTAVVRADGSPEWGFERSPSSGRPLPLSTGETRGRPELDLFIQNLVRADIERLLAGEA